MWREDDVEDNGKHIKPAPKDKSGQLINKPDLEREGKAEGSDKEPRS